MLRNSGAWTPARAGNTRGWLKLGGGLLLALATAGCLGDQFGGVTDGGYARLCKLVQRTQLGPSEVSPLGFTGNDALEIAEGTHEAVLIWGEERDDVLLTPAAGETRIEFVVTSENATFWFADYEPDESNWSFSSVECPDALEIDVEIGVRTDNGALEEKASTTLSSRQPLLVTGRLDLIPGAMSGSWHLTYEASASQGGGETVKSADFLEPHLWFGFTPGGLVSGGFDTGVEVVTESAAGLSEVSFGHFPEPSPCGAAGFRHVELTPETAQGALLTRLLSDFVQLDLAWDGGSEDTLELNVNTPTYCMGEDTGIPGWNRGSIFFETAASVTSAEGIELTPWNLFGDAEINATGDVVQVRLRLDAEDRGRLPPEEFLARYGLSSLSLDGFDRATWSLVSTWTEAGGWEGVATVEARGESDPCNPDVSGLLAEELGPECSHEGWSPADTAIISVQP